MKRLIKPVVASMLFMIFFMVFTGVEAEEAASKHQHVVPHFTDSFSLATIDSNVSILPSSLEIIEDSAFEGTAISNINLQEKVETIGDYAFANIQTLRKISIPNSTTYIGRNAFKGSTNVMVTGAPKGYARAWANENGIPFSPNASFYAINNTVQVNEELTSSRAERLDVDKKQTEEEKPKPTGRMAGELNAERKETITAFHIQGRSPPMA